MQDRGQYYYKYIGWAYQNGIVSGESPTSFGINSAITRQDCCKILNNFAKKFYQIYNRVSVSTFSDDAQIASYAKADVYTCARGQVVAGYSDNTFRPKTAITRAAAATILTNYIQFHVNRI